MGGLNKIVQLDETMLNLNARVQMKITYNNSDSLCIIEYIVLLHVYMQYCTRQTGIYSSSIIPNHHVSSFIIHT